MFQSHTHTDYYTSFFTDSSSCEVCIALSRGAKFSKHLETTFKFYVPDDCNEAVPYRGPTTIRCHRTKTIREDLCTLILFTNHSKCNVLQSLFRYSGTWRGVVTWGTALQARSSRVHFPMVSLEFFMNILLPAVLWPPRTFRNCTGVAVPI
jgi:hypothetical protein